MQDITNMLHEFFQFLIKGYQSFSKYYNEETNAFNSSLKDTDLALSYTDTEILETNAFNSSLKDTSEELVKLLVQIYSFQFLIKGYFTSPRLRVERFRAFNSSLKDTHWTTYSRLNHLQLSIPH